MVTRMNIQLDGMKKYEKSDIIGWTRNWQFEVVLMKIYSGTSVRNGRCFSFGLDCFGTKCDGNFLKNNKSKNKHWHQSIYSV